MEIFILIKKDFINSLVRIMSDNKCKAKVDSLLCNGTYSFTYDMKTTELGQFPDPEIFHVNNFQVCTSVAVEVRVQSRNFNPMEANKVTHGYLFKPVNLYCIEDVQVA